MVGQLQLNLEISNQQQLLKNFDIKVHSERKGLKIKGLIVIFLKINQSVKHFNATFQKWIINITKFYKNKNSFQRIKMVNLYSNQFQED